MNKINEYFPIICAVVIALTIGIGIGASLDNKNCIDITKQYKNENHIYCWSKVYYTGDKPKVVCFTFKGVNYCREVDL